MPRHLKQRSLHIAVVAAIFVLGGLGGCSKSETSASLLADARQYQQKGDTKAALIQVKNAVAKSPEDGDARLQLSALYLDGGDAVSAEKEIRKAMTLGISVERAAPLLGKSLLAQFKFQAVLDEISPALAAKSAPLLAMRGDAYLFLNDSAKATASYQQALALQPASGEALMGLARHSLMQKDQASADRFLADAVAKDGSNSDVWMLKAIALRSQGKQDEAMAAYDQVIKLRPAHRTAHIEKAQIEIGQKKFDAAKADLAAARKVVAGGDLLLSYTQALLDFSEEKYAPANEVLQKILGIAPDHLPSVLLAGAVELKLGMLKQSEQHLRKYLQAAPANVYARKLLAQSLLQGGQPAEAVAVLAPALNATSTDPQLLALAGEAYLKAKQYSKSSGYFTQASALAPKMASLHTSLGLSKLAEGDHANAVSELELGASLESTTPDAGMALVRTQLALKHYDEALAAVLKLETRRPADEQVQLMKGAVYLARKDSANARASFEKAVSLKPGNFPAISALAQLDMQDKKPQEAKRRFEALLAKDPKNVAAMTSLAQMAGGDGHLDEGLVWLEKASNDNPDDLAAAMRLSAAYLRVNQPQKALMLVRKLQTANPANADLLDLLGQAQLATTDLSGALETYSKLVNIVPSSANAQLRLANVHMMMKNPDAAERDVKKALALQPDSLPAQMAQAELAARSGHPEQAVAIARQIQKRQPAVALGYVLEGDLMLAQGKAPAAAQAYERALTLEPGSAAHVVKLHKALQLSGKNKEADGRLAQWRTAHPDDLIALAYLGESQMVAKQYKLAIDSFENVLKKAPNNPALLNNLAIAYQQEKDPRALATAEQALKAAPDNPAILDTLGWMLVTQEKTARGLSLLQKAVGLAPASTELRYHLAFALNKSGDKAAARTEVNKLLSSNKSFPQIEETKALLRVL